jgi:vitamin B12 transporter
MRKKIMLVVLVLTVQYGYAQDSLRSTTLNEVVISGTRFELPAEKSGKIIFKFNRKELEKRTGESLTNVLNEVPGVQMNGNFSSPGANPAYYVRGGRTQHTLITLDGIPLMDPSGIDPYFDLRFIPVSQLESIEVLQGSLSTLYGSNAAAGVINLQSKKNTQRGVHGSVNADAGSWNSFGQGVHLSGRFQKFSFSLSANNYFTDGFSAAQDNDPATTFDKDGFKRQNTLLNAGFDFTSQFSVQAFMGYDWFENEHDAWTFTDGDYKQTYDQFRYGLKSKWHYEKGHLDFLIQRNTINRSEHSFSDTRYEGIGIYSELTHKHNLSKGVVSLSGISFHKLNYGESGVNKSDTTTFTLVDPYTSLLLDLPFGLNIHAGLRLNTHSEYGSKLVYNINPSWLMKVNANFKLKLFGSVSTAYITPTLFQLYTPLWGGNPELKPEEDFSVEYGATFYLNEKIQFTAVNYYRTETNAIGYSDEYSYVNVTGNRYVQGFTLDAKYSLSEKLFLKADYAYVTSNKKETFLRIPSHKAGLSSIYQAPFGTSLSILYQYTGKRTDTNFPDQVTLAAFDLVDVTLSHELLNKKLLVYVTAANLFDEDFVGVYGYTTRGRNFLSGLRFNF